jgi:uncharacterized protein
MNATLLSFLLLGLVSCSHNQQVRYPAALEAAYPSRIIDAHMHFETKNADVPEPGSKMREEAQSANVVGAIVHLHGTEEVLRAKDSNLKLRVCAGIRPEISAKTVEAGLKAKRFHCMKIYLGYVPKWANDSFYKPFYKLAERYQVPLVFHTGDTYDKMASVKYADPLQIDEIAITYPKVKFVIAHMGNPWFQSAAEVVYKNDNVYVDMSALLLGDVSEQPNEVVEELVVKPVRWFFYYVENPKKFLFGSDWSLMRIRPYVQLLQRAIPKEHWDAVFYSNAAELFQIK